MAVEPLQIGNEEVPALLLRIAVALERIAEQLETTPSVVEKSEPSENSKEKRAFIGMKP